MFLSDFLELGLKGHVNFDFVDVYLDDDNRLFIDPCLIEGADDHWCQQANAHMRCFFDQLFISMRANGLYANSILEHAHEQNGTKLGYGNGLNGKGKTAEGLADSLAGLRELVRTIPSINRAQDLPVLVEHFAEDCLSDLLTNVLHDMLYRFTAEQMAQYGREPDRELQFWTWDLNSGNWVQVTRSSWLYDGKELLLVPKWIVRKSFLFRAHQYLYGVIIERMQHHNGWEDLKKIDVWNNLARETKHWVYDTVIAFTQKHPDALTEYHERMPRYYARAHGLMSDDELDLAVYGHVVVMPA